MTKQQVPAYKPEELEPRWRAKWREEGLDKVLRDEGKPKFYCLDFFPYPSGDGLSVGHCRNYVPTDVISRYHRMKGMNVLHPMGWDAFGLPAENRAIQEGVHPSILTKQYTRNYRRQLELIGTSYDWSREIASTHPDYYRFTQWFFLLLHERGLAYRAEGWQWWCDDCQTILANEQVEGGNCWRHGTRVTRKKLAQWYFRITDYADRLLEDLDALDWPDRIKAMQRNWIGRSEGAMIRFKTEQGDELPVFTTRPDTLMGVTFMCLAPEHPLVAKLVAAEQRAEVEGYVEASRTRTEIDRLALGEAKEKSGVNLGACAIHPLTGKRIPLWVADYVIMGYGTGAVMAVPAHDQRDYEFAQAFDIPVKQVIRPADGSRPPENAAFTEAGIMVNSGEFDGLRSAEGGKAVTERLAAKGLGEPKVTYRIRDWLISRQRFWGAPIPMVHCKACGIVPVQKDDLPVRLPDEVDFQPTGTGRSPLANVRSWVETACPSCQGPAERETDTMDGFACSSWYFLRFASPRYEKAPFDAEEVRYWLPVDLYVGGAEHAVMHLLYARFWTKVMYDAGLVPFQEPFTVLRNQGVLHAPDGARMSKSKGNVVTPDAVVARYGADVLRTYLCFMAPFEDDVIWSDRDIAGCDRFIKKIWRFVHSASPSLEKGPEDLGAATGAERDLVCLTHRTIRQVTDDFERLHFNTAIARMMELFPAMVRLHGKEPGSAAVRFALRTLLHLLAPIAPHVTEELWTRQGGPFSIHRQRWPEFDPELAKEEIVTLVIQVNGKLRDRLEVPHSIAKAKAMKLARESPRVATAIAGKDVVREIFVPGKLVNLVAK